MDHSVGSGEDGQKRNALRLCLFNSMAPTEAGIQPGDICLTRGIGLGPDSLKHRQSF